MNSNSSNKMLGGVEALVRSHIIGLVRFERTIEQTTETTSPKPITAANNQKNDKLTKAAALLKMFPGHGNNPRNTRENNDFCGY